MVVTYGSCFTGIGGLDLAVEDAFGARALWMCERDEFCRGVLARHWPGVPVHDDITTMETTDAPDIICGGFPCQDVSVAGSRAGIDGERTGLVAHQLRLVRVLRPRVIVLENVPGVLVGLGRVLGPLAALGYDAAWGVLGACCVGAPHRRERVFIVAADPDREPLRLESEPKRRGPGAPPARPDGEPRALADADGARQLQPQGGLAEVGGRAGDGGLAPVGAHAARQRLGGRLQPASRRGRNRAENATGSSRREAQRDHSWAAEPDVGRVAHGVPGRVDRLRALGNAVVWPQAAAAIRKIYAEVI